jgi:hypothetical protein
MSVIENSEETVYHSDTDVIYVVDNENGELIGVY